jgi:cytochrome bd-type quinol oxidase subunit 2
MSEVSRIRVAAALGLLSIVLAIIGFIIHGYPTIGASGQELVDWAATTDQQQFEIGIYIEALGYLLFLPFAAWLWAVARGAEDDPGWLVTAGFGAAALYVGISVVDNGVWSAVLNSARHGADPQTLASIRDVAQYIFYSTLLFGGLFFVSMGYVLFRTRALPRWVGATAAVIGLGLLVPPLALITALLVWIWTVVVSLYLLARPRAVATVREPSDAMAGPAAAGTP